MKKSLFLLLSAVILLLSVSSCKTSSKTTKSGLASAKQEFRGAWVQTVFQDRYNTKTTDQCKKYLDELVGTLYKSGFNAVIFQVRPEGDAFYNSMYEPWSRFLTGTQGKAPSPLWDPMQYLIDLCHCRGMEFHAWINPYRMYASKNLNLAYTHLYNSHPEYFVTYGGKLYLNPGMPESREWIRKVIKDIVSRYDVDAIHMDDYFYPYPVGGENFNDKAAYQTYGPQLGFSANTVTDLYNFRRRSVDILIKSVNEDIKALKPWVRFGISPFGIYRNKSSWEGGSETNGTQCYDDLFADVLFWAKSGWIDYIMPQIYWARGNKVADYVVLTDWWAANVPATCQLYIGQSIDKSLDGKNVSLAKSNKELTAKMKQARSLQNVDGNCFWYAYQVEDNTYNVRDYLSQTVYKEHAMVPAFTNLSSKRPDKISDLNAKLYRTPKGGHFLNLTWKAPKGNIRYYNVYRFAKGQKVNIKSMAHLLKQVNVPQCVDETILSDVRYTYVVTPVDFYNNEGKPVKASFTASFK